MNRTLAALMMTAAALTATPTLAQTAKGPTAVVSPQPLPIDDSRPRVFLGGSIDMGGAPDWQEAMTAALADMGLQSLPVWTEELQLLLPASEAGVAVEDAGSSTMPFPFASY